jgi:mannose-6-phosphate isomerase
MHLTPLLFEPVLLKKVWGGDALAAFGKKIHPGDTIGESWELADLAATSASGAGGQGVRSVISNGPMAGKTIADALKHFGPALLGKTKLTPGGAFPLLVKFLDARENLSVQVHPSQAYADTHTGANLKTECWYILDARPGAKIYKGVRDGVSKDQFAAALRSGDGSGVVELLHAVRAAQGECHDLPSGTVHALGAGVTVAEVQTPSDTTFRVYDWGRQGRELHIEQALDCIDFAPAPDATFARRGARFACVVKNNHYKLDVATITPTDAVRVGVESLGGTGCYALTVAHGSGTIASRANKFEPIPLPIGTTALIGASIALDCELTTNLEMTVLRTEVS